MKSTILTTPRDDKQQAVLEAATSVFLAHGFSAATTDMIQREAKVSKKTMYACFPSKESLFIAVIERECAVLTKSFKAIHVNGDIAKTLTDLGTSYLQLILSPTATALYRVVIAEAPRFPELGRRFYMAGPKVIYEKLAEYLSEATKNREINIQAIGAPSASTLFMNMVRGEAQLEYLTHPQTKPSAVQIDQWVKLAVETFLSAFEVKS